MKKIILPLLLAPALSYGIGLDSYYGGLKVSKRNMGFELDYGDTLFAGDFTQYSLFSGVGLSDSLDAEAEVFSNRKKSRSFATVLDGQNELGVTDFSGLGDDTYSTSARMYGAGIHLRAHTPVRKNINVFATAGVNYAKLSVQADMILNDGVEATVNEKNNNRIEVNSAKLIPRVSTGVDVKVNQNFGVRADITWEKTGRFKMSTMTIAGNPNSYEIRAKDSFIYGLSVYYAV